MEERTTGNFSAIDEEMLARIRKITNRGHEATIHQYDDGTYDVFEMILEEDEE